MRKRSSIPTIIFILIIIGIGYAFAKGYVGVNRKNDEEAVGGGSPEMENLDNEKQATLGEQEEVKMTGNIFYLVRGKDRADIYNMDIATGEAKIVFTDADEDLKIKEAIGIVKNGAELLLLMAPQDQPFGGNLYLVSADGNASKNELQKDFASPVNPAVSADGKYLAEVIFSNAEPSFGFTLYAQELPGGAKQEIAKNEGGINILRWSPDGGKIAFVKGGSADNNEIMVADKDGKNLAQVSESMGKAIIALSWKDNETLIFSREKEIYQYDLKNKKEAKMIANDKDKKDVISVGNGLVYLALDAPTSLSGQMVLVDLNGKTSKSLGAAEDLVGWSK